MFALFLHRVLSTDRVVKVAFLIQELKAYLNDGAILCTLEAVILPWE